MYCPFLGTDYKKSTFTKIHVAFNNAYKNFLSLHIRGAVQSAMYANHNVCSFETMLKKTILGFMQRLENSTNTIIWNFWIESLYLTAY